MEGGRQLEVAIVDVDARVADGGRPSAVPVVIQIRGDADVAQRLADDGRSSVARVGLGADVYWRIVEIVLNAAAEDVLQAEYVVGRRLDVRADADAPSPVMAAPIEPVLEEIVVHDVAEGAADLDVAPATTHAVMPGEIGRGEPADDFLQFEAIGHQAGVTAGARGFDRNPDVGIGNIVRVRLPEHLGVAEEQHPVWPPVVQDVRENIDVHELAVGQPRANLPPLSPGVAKPYRGLSGIDADAEQVELEGRLHQTPVGRELAFDAKAALPRAQVEVTVSPELIMERWEFAGPDHVEPIGVVLIEVHNGVGL